MKIITFLRKKSKLNNSLFHGVAYVLFLFEIHVLSSTKVLDTYTDKTRVD